MTYQVDITIRGTVQAHHVLAIFPGLTLRDCTPSFRRQRAGYEPTNETRFSLEGMFTSAHVDSLDLMNVLASIGEAFLGLRMERSV